MPFASFEDQQIHYRVFNAGDGPPVIWHHGLMGSSDTLLETPVPETLKGRFELLALDSLGHGQSSKPDDPAHYTRVQRAGNIAAVLDHAGHDTAHYFGYSMGGWLGCAMARHQSHCLRSLTVAGWDVDHAVETMPPRRAEEVFDFANDLFESAGEPSPVPAMLADKDLTRGISRCWEALWEVDGARGDLLALGIPLQLICGVDDHFYPNVKTLADETGIALVSVPGDHVSGTPSVYERLEDLCAFWRAAEGG